MARPSPQSNGKFEHHFRERFDSLLPSIQGVGPIWRSTLGNKGQRR